ncbi:MAG: efflux RND transporter periplasmic adaptor subunit [Clostridiales bacterium]|nr:efflux RND transporter periplasmic adaptor subunit [Clostridiales bacterium]
MTAAKLELEQVRTQMKKINLSAAHDYETDVTYGNAAQLEYDETIDQLQEAYDTAVEKLEEAREELEELQTKEQELMAKLEESKHLYDETTYRTDYIDKEDDPYGYISTLTLRDTIEATRDSDEDALEEKQDAIDKKKEEIETLEKELKTAEKEMRSGAVTAKASYDTRVLRLEKGKQIYDLSVGIGEQDYAEAEDAYAEAKEKLEEFDRCIQDCNVISDSSGVITEIGLEAGDTLSRGMSLITLKDYGKTGITVTVGDDDIDKIAVGDTANISITAFPDMQFYGTVTEIGDAQVNTYSSAITYEVTVDIEGDVDGIYSGMTSEVTFITKETKEVLYVSNRAIKRDGSRSYVYIHDEEGNVTEKDVETGFSDGINVEIKEGLSNGETVLIESKVNGE